MHLAVLAVAPLVAQEPSRELASWHQPGANALQRNACEAEPVVALPELLWSKEPGTMLVPPVAWGQTIFAAAQGATGKKLLAWSSVDGAAMGSANLDKSRELGLAVWENQAVVVQEQLVSIFAQRGKELRAIKLLPGKWTSAPLVHRGHAMVRGSGGWQAIDIAKGKVVASLQADTDSMTVASPSLDELVWLETRSAPNPAYRIVVGVRLPFEDWIAGRGAKPRSLPLGSPLAFEQAGDESGMRVQHVDEAKSWLLSNMPGLLGFSKPMPGAFSTSDDKLFGMSIQGRPTFVQGGIYGFDRDGVLIHQLPDGSYLPVVQAADLPGGAAPGATTAARDVLYVGNWAVQLTGSRRVLWVSKDTPAGLPALPLGDRRIVYQEPKRLSAWGPKGGPAADGASNGTGVARADAEDSAPGDGDGLVLADGRRVRGKVESRSDGSFRVVGAERVHAAAEVALVESGGVARLVGREEALHQAWRRALSQRHRAALSTAFDGYLKSRLVEDCRRLLAECAAFGAGAAEERGMGERLAGVAQSTASNAASQRERLLADEAKLRAAGSARVHDAMRWCAERGWTRTSSALAGLARRIDASETESRVLAAAWVPPEFPWLAAPDALERWILWSGLLLPSDGAFVAAEDPLWGRLKGGPWSSERGAIALRSRNLLFVSRTDDAAIVSSCLRDGELAIGVLELVLEGNASGRKAADDAQRLEVRLHRNRDEYVREYGEDEVQRLSRTAGYFVPAENVSRFFVPDMQLLQGARERSLYSTVAHELTHHYMDVVWNKDRGADAGVQPDAPGFWVVEGMADFVEEQTVEHERRGTGFDDDTVPALDACAALKPMGGLYPVEMLAKMTQLQFGMLAANQKTVEVRLRHTLEARPMDATAVYYAQSAALTFYFMHRAGADGRRRYVDYMRLVYTANAPEQAWSALGHADAQSLQRAFDAFLDSLTGR